MIHPDFMTNDIIEISDIWCTETGEQGCRTYAYMRGTEIASVVVYGAQVCRMCRNAVVAVLSMDIVKKIEARNP